MMDARSLSRTLFRIIYSSSYTFLFLILLILLCATPGDQIYQTLRAHHVGNIPVVGATYFVTFLIAAFIYASRLYSTRQALFNIPKPYLPIEEGELGRNVRKMIVRNRQRSALIAFESRPRDLSSSEHHTGILDGEEPATALARYDVPAAPEDSLIPFPPDNPPWGPIAHAGWSSPSARDTPSLHFAPVLAELPHLIEAKAVSLAPPDPALAFLAPSPTSQAQGAPPDPAIVARLQRAPHLSLRGYVAHLAALRVLDRDIGGAFVAAYERARFSTDALSEQEFRELMGLFSSLLVGIEGTVGAAGSEGDGESIWEESDDASGSGSVRTFQPAGDAVSIQSSESVLHHQSTD